MSPKSSIPQPTREGAASPLLSLFCRPPQSRAHHGEETVEKLAIYTANQFDHVRVEACDTCHYYIKTVDLTKNGLAVPVVDELATIPLNLWAQEHRYVKLQANLLGI